MFIVLVIQGEMSNEDIGAMHGDLMSRFSIISLHTLLYIGRDRAESVIIDFNHISQVLVTLSD